MGHPVDSRKFFVLGWDIFLSGVGHVEMAILIPSPAHTLQRVCCLRISVCFSNALRNDLTGQISDFCDLGDFKGD